jgi:hypothetical protein
MDFLLQRWETVGLYFFVLCAVGFVTFAFLAANAGQDDEDPNQKTKIITYNVFLLLFASFLLGMIYLHLNRNPARVLELAHQKARREMTPSFESPEQVPLRGPHRVGLNKSLRWGQNQTLEITPRKLKSAKYE